MSQTYNLAEPELEEPGTGLPWLEMMVSRYFIFPYICRKMSRSEAIEIAMKRAQTCLKEVRNLSHDDVHKKVLIPRISGLEDSSRYWSACMVIHHLLIVHKGVTKIITHLAHGKKAPMKINIEDVKPKDKLDEAQLFIEYEQIIGEYENVVASLDDLNDLNYTHAHPWFGELSAHEWLCLNAVHYGIHLKQIGLIKERI